MEECNGIVGQDNRRSVNSVLMRRGREGQPGAGPDRGRGKEMGFKTTKGKFKTKNKLNKIHPQGQKRIDLMIGRMMEEQGPKTLVNEIVESSIINGSMTITQGDRNQDGPETIRTRTPATVKPKP